MPPSAVEQSVFQQAVLKNINDNAIDWEGIATDTGMTVLAAKKRWKRWKEKLAGEGKAPSTPKKQVKKQDGGKASPKKRARKNDYGEAESGEEKE